jgi:putative transposase
MMAMVGEHGRRVGIQPLCAALGIPRASYYRRRRPARPHTLGRVGSSRALSAGEREAVLQALHEPRFVDHAPAEIYATLLDEGVYHCSLRTMYRILAANQEVRERRNQLRHPAYAAPELLATKPNQVWSWDITKLRGPRKWTHYYLYVILDIFSRYVVGWMIADCESATLAHHLIDETRARQAIQPGQLTLHADRGPSMTSKLVANLLADLGITRTHSRPYTSDDNPYSESQFKTLKYRPDFPADFGCLEDARGFSRDFFGWYNDEHHHSGLGFLTPRDVHYGLAADRIERRAAVLAEAHGRYPQRFVKGRPRPQPPPAAAWINKPKEPPEPTAESTRPTPEQ